MKLPRMQWEDPWTLAGFLLGVAVGGAIVFRSIVGCEP